VKEAQDAVNKQKDLLKACNKDISQRIGDQKDLQKEHHGSQLKIQELEHKISKFQSDSKSAAREVSSNIVCVFRSSAPEVGDNVL
jgi:structural maintenance of chromosome 2